MRKKTIFDLYVCIFQDWGDNSYNKHSNKTLYPSKNLTYFLLYWIFLIGNNAHWVVLMQHSISPYTREGWVYIRLEGCAILQQFSTSRQNLFFLIILKKISSFFSLNIYIQIFFYILGNFEKTIDPIPVCQILRW